MRAHILALMFVALAATAAAQSGSSQRRMESEEPPPETAKPRARNAAARSETSAL